MLKSRLKRSFLSAAILVLAMIFAFYIPGFAAEGIRTDKAVYLAGEEITIQVSGLSEEQLANQAPWAGIFKKSTTNLNNVLNYNYVSDSAFDGGKWTTKVPTELGSYEVRLVLHIDGNDKLIAACPFSVESKKANAGDVSLSKSILTIKEEAILTVKGIAESQVHNGAWIGLYKKGMALDKYNGYEYFSNLSVGADGSYQYVFKAPDAYGDYELKVFTQNTNELKVMEQVLYATVSFKVGSSTAKEGDVKLSKTTCLARDTLTLTFKADALTDEQISDGAWFGLYKANDAIEVNPEALFYVNDIKAKNMTAEIKAPSELGGYEIRIFSKNTPYDKEQLTAAKFAVLPFKVVSVKSNDKTDIKIKNSVMTDSQRFMMKETIKVVVNTHPNQAASEAAIKAGKSGGISPGQLEAGAWAGLFKLGDKNFASPIEWVTLNDASVVRNTTADGRKIWEFEAPSEPGEYIIKVFTANVDAAKRDSVFFAEMPLTILNGTKINKGEGAFDWTNYALSVAPSAVTVKAKKFVTLNVTAIPKPGKNVTPLEVNNLVKFTVKDPRIATVRINSSGKAVITGIKKGTTKLILTVKGTRNLTKTITITVK